MHRTPVSLAPTPEGDDRALHAKKEEQERARAERLAQRQAKEATALRRAKAAREEREREEERRRRKAAEQAAQQRKKAAQAENLRRQEEELRARRTAEIAARTSAPTTRAAIAVLENSRLH